MVEQLSLPVTAKIRLLHPEGEKGDSSAVDVPRTVALCQDMAAAGVQLITIHARNVFGKKQHTGAPHWEALGQVVQALQGRVPVVANGGVGSREEALRCLELTGADAVMSSEGLLENPRLFEAGREQEQGGYLRCQLDVAEEYISLVEVYGDGLDLSVACDTLRDLSASGVSAAKGHVFKFLFRMIQAERNWDLREDLSKARHFDAIKVIVQKLRDRAEDINYCDDRALSEGRLVSKSWYQRQR
jgi:tRNA-dihydrouridine synthase